MSEQNIPPYLVLLLKEARFIRATELTSALAWWYVAFVTIQTTVLGNGCQVARKPTELLLPPPLSACFYYDMMIDYG